MTDLHTDKDKINEETAPDEKGMTAKGRGDTPNQHDQKETEVQDQEYGSF